MGKSENRHYEYILNTRKTCFVISNLPISTIHLYIRLTLWQNQVYFLVYKFVRNTRCTSPTCTCPVFTYILAMFKFRKCFTNLPRSDCFNVQISWKLTCRGYREIEHETSRSRDSAWVNDNHVIVNDMATLINYQ